MKKSLLEISRIDDVTSRFRMFFLFENIEYREEMFVFVLEKKDEYRSDDQNDDCYEDNYGSHCFVHTR